jgi:predicted ATPase
MDMGWRVSAPYMVGRDAQAAALIGALDETTAGSSAVVLISGAAGIGKTRLVTTSSSG